MKRIIVILVVLAALVGAAISQSAVKAASSISFNDTEIMFEKTYSCQIMTIAISGHHVLRHPDADHTTLTMIYVGGWNPYVEINVLPTSCAPGG
jgi:hypothetical protein